MICCGLLTCEPGLNQPLLFTFVFFQYIYFLSEAHQGRQFDSPVSTFKGSFPCVVFGGLRWTVKAWEASMRSRAPFTFPTRHSRRCFLALFVLLTRLCTVSLKTIRNTSIFLQILLYEIITSPSMFLQISFPVFRIVNWYLIGFNASFCSLNAAATLPAQ